MDKYRVGDVVRVRKDLSEDRPYGAMGAFEYAVDDMVALAGKDVEIVGIRGGYYRVKDDPDYKWTEDMFQGLVKPRYKVGDKVIVRKDLVVGGEYGIDLDDGECLFVGEMNCLKGKTVTISYVSTGIFSGSIRYHIKEDDDVWWWTDDMFVGPAPKEEPEDKMEDNAEDKREYVGWSGINNLRVGDKVRFRTDMELNKSYGIDWLEGMQEYAGRLCTVCAVIGNTGSVHLAEDPDVIKWYFSPKMFHEVWRDGVKLGGGVVKSANTESEDDIDCSEAEDSFFSGKLVCVRSNDDGDYGVIDVGQVVIVDDGKFTWKGVRFHHVFGISAVVWAFNKAFDTKVEFVKLREAH